MNATSWAGRPDLERAAQALAEAAKINSVPYRSPSTGLNGCRACDRALLIIPTLVLGRCLSVSLALEMREAHADALICHAASSDQVALLVARRERNHVQWWHDYRPWICADGRTFRIVQEPRRGWGPTFRITRGGLTQCPAGPERAEMGAGIERATAAISGLLAKGA